MLIMAMGSLVIADRGGEKTEQCSKAEQYSKTEQCSNAEQGLEAEQGRWALSVAFPFRAFIKQAIWLELPAMSNCRFQRIGFSANRFFSEQGRVRGHGGANRFGPRESTRGAGRKAAHRV